MTSGDLLTFGINELKSTVFLEIILAVISPFLTNIRYIFARFLKNKFYYIINYYVMKHIINNVMKTTVGSSFKSLYRNSGLFFHIELYFLSRDP